MSELINTRDNRATIRWKLLTSVSATAMLVSAYAAGEAQAADSDRPQLWIELGGQLARLSNSEETFAPAFMTSVTQPALLWALNVQRPPVYSLGEEGKISFQPEDSDWDFSASIHYGRSQAAQHNHHQTPNAKFPVHITAPPALSFLAKYYSFYPAGHKKFADGSASQSEQHAIIDFQAGKDIGLGMFGMHGSSMLSAGVRIAQFRSRSNIDLRAEPAVQYPSAPISGPVFTALPRLDAFKSSTIIDFNDYNGMLKAQRSFRGIGPSLAWDASAPLAGNADHGELTFDWGANAAVLFGRQKTRNHTQTTILHYHGSGYHFAIRGHTGSGKDTVKDFEFFNSFGTIAQSHVTHAHDFNRTRSVTVPNVGGFAGLSFRYADAKISFGYRADFFFGAIDGGISNRKEENQSFYGPFASISIGIGD